MNTWGSMVHYCTASKVVKDGWGKLGVTRGVMVSSSAFLACHQC